MFLQAFVVLQMTHFLLSASNMVVQSIKAMQVRCLSSRLLLIMSTEIEYCVLYEPREPIDSMSSVYFGILTNTDNNIVIR